MINTSPATSPPAFSADGVLFIATELAGHQWRVNKPLGQADLIAVAVRAENAGYIAPAGDSPLSCYTIGALCKIFRHVDYDPYRFYSHFCEAVAVWN